MDPAASTQHFSRSSGSSTRRTDLGISQPSFPPSSPELWISIAWDPADPDQRAEEQADEFRLEVVGARIVMRKSGPVVKGMGGGGSGGEGIGRGGGTKQQRAAEGSLATWRRGPSPTAWRKGVDIRAGEESAAQEKKRHMGGAGASLLGLWEMWLRWKK